MAELPASKPARRRRRWAWPVAGILATSATAAIAIVALRDDEPPTTKVTFEVTGSSTALQWLIWRTPEGEQALTTPPSLPWSKTVELTANEGPLFLNAIGDVNSPHSAIGETLSCRITVDGLVMEQIGPSTMNAQCWTTLQRAFKAKAEQQ